MAYGWLNLIIALAGAIISSIILYDFSQKSRLNFILIVASTTPLATLIAYLWFTPYIKVLCFQRQLYQQPVFSNVAAKDPAIFNDFFKAARPQALQMQTTQQLKPIAEKVAQRAFAAALSKAPDSALINYLKAAVALYQQWFPQEAAAIIKFEFPVAFKDSTVSVLDSANLDAVHKAQADLIIAALKNPQPVPDYADIKYLIDPILSSLKDQYGNDNIKLVFNQPANSALDAKTGAKIIIDFYEQLLKLSPEEAGKVVRFMKKI